MRHGARKAVVAFMFISACAVDENAAPQQPNPPISQRQTEVSSADDLDDKEFVPLAQVLRQADEIVVGEILAVSEDRRRITILTSMPVKGAIQADSEVVIPNPRLTVNARFESLRPTSQYVFVLIVDAESAWRTPEFGDESAFRISDGRIMLPLFYDPGVTRPAQGYAEITQNAFFAAAQICHEESMTRCSQAVGELFADAD